MTLPRMDPRIGLDYIVENREYVSKLGAALDTSNTTVKKQVFELLSALCAYNSEGYSRAIETLEYYKNIKNERYRFKIAINELENATSIEYQVALLAFINCVIISASNVQNRIRIRNEFIGLQVLPILTCLRKVAHSVGDIIEQLDVFDEQRECDQAQSLQGPHKINLNCHLDVFNAILGQVADTPQDIPFLSILQHLLRIDPKEPVSDVIWDTTEKLVHRATLLENHEDATRLLRSPSVQKFSCPHCRSDATSPSRKTSAVPLTPLSQSQSQQFTDHVVTVQPVANPNAAPPPPPPPPIPPGPPRAPPPPPPPAMGNFKIPGAPPPPPPSSSLSAKPNHESNSNRPKTPDPGFGEMTVLLPQQDTPVPRTKMKTINWNKIPPNKVIGKQNIWTIVADNHQDSPMADIDWNEMEGLFCLQSTSTQGSPKLGRDNGHDTLDRKPKKENSEITLLDGKRSLNVNIFLKQFRSCNEDIIQLIKEGSHDDIGAEKLRGLLKILPEVDELDMLKSFDGDKTRLGNAEKFLLQLLEVPSYKLRIESMLLKEEFAANIGYLEPCINAILFAGDDLMNNKMLQEVLYMVVVAGNFLNSGGYAGNAAGVKLSSLQKLTDIRANKPGMNLIHYVALQAEKKNPELLNFPVQMTTLENASKTTSEQIKNEINALETRIKKIKKQVDLPATDEDIKEQMVHFLQEAEREVSMLQRGMKEVEVVRIKLADFFCEDPGSFKIEECLKIFQIFCDKFKQAVKENDRRRVQEEQATLRRKQREEQMTRRARQIGQCSTPVSDSENSLLLDPTFDPRSSPAFSRRRMGSFNSTSGDCSTLREDGVSPDITPNGSLRRRRSRVLAEEDDLMEFLRSSGHDNSNRERKASSYGSLDRSWARRARSGSASRKRPELLNIDFGNDRERANSPSPLNETNPVTSTEDSKPRISREWRQKIESWLQSNDSDEKQNDDYKRRRRLANNSRRSLETETESERNKLDTLPEEKADVNASAYKRVYPDWKPSATLQKTDVVGAIEAIEDDHTKKKETDDNKKYLRLNGHQPVAHGGGALGAIAEEDRRKSVIQKLGERSSSDRLQVYIRRPSETSDNSPEAKPSQLKSPTARTFRESPNSNKHSVAELSTLRDRHEEKYSRIEIDADNIETPPVARRALPSPGLRGSFPVTETAKPIETKPEESEALGHFDRFSAARRTRRYKRPTDYSSGNEEISPTVEPVPSQNIDNCVENIVERVDNKTERLQRWQDRIKDVVVSAIDHKGKTNIPGKTVTKLEKVGRHISSINQEDVREAIRNLKSPTGTPDRIWSPPREIMKEKTKSSNHELNDEGFEETQSLVSDTPSHGKESTSSCNETNEAVTKRSPKTSTIPKSRIIPQKTQIQNILERNKRSIERARSMRVAVASTSGIAQPQPKRSTSVRKTESTSSNTSPSHSKRDVERSSSRTSLRSSRSSLNSAISTNTVRRMPVAKPTMTHSVESSPSKRPLTVQNSTIKVASTSYRAPASRSSSSGSSIGPGARKQQLKSSTTTALGSTSFKENQSSNPSLKTAARNAVLLKTSITNPASIAVTPQRSPSRIASSTNSRLSGFMRPTASSATKRTPSEGPNRK